MRIKTIIFLSLIGMTITSCTENWKLQQVDSDTLSIGLPIGSTEVSKSTDSICYKFEYSTPAPNYQSISVVAFPWIKNPQEAIKVFGDPYNIGLCDGVGTDFNYDTVSGIKYENNDEKHVLKGEAFCFNKNGYTILIYSYGKYDSYHTIRDVVRSIQIKRPPLNKTQKEKIFNPLKIAKKLSKQMFHALNGNGNSGNVCDSTSWKLTISLADSAAVPVIYIDCWLNDRAIEGLYGTIDGNYLLRLRFGSPLNSLNIPIATSLKMIGDDYFRIVFNYYDKHGDKLDFN